MKDVIAKKDGFYNGARIKAGTKFKVGDTETGRWFVDAKDYVAPVIEPMVQEIGNAAKRKAESFIQAMKTPVATTKPEKAPATMSEHNKKTPI